MQNLLKKNQWCVIYIWYRKWAAICWVDTGDMLTIREYRNHLYLLIHLTLNLKKKHFARHYCKFTDASKSNQSSDVLFSSDTESGQLSVGLRIFNPQIRRSVTPWKCDMLAIRGGSRPHFSFNSLNLELEEISICHDLKSFISGSQPPTAHTELTTMADLKKVFQQFANTAVEGEAAVMDKKKVKRALKVSAMSQIP